MPRRNRRTRSRRRNRKTDLLKWLGISPNVLSDLPVKPLGLGLLTLGIAAFGGPLIPDLLAQSKDDCETGQITHVVTALADTTDEIEPEIQASADAIWMEFVPSLIQSGSEVFLNALNGTPGSPIRREFKDCSPKRGADDNPVFSTSSRTEERWDDQFGNPYGEAVRVLPSANYKQTPFLQGVEAIYAQADQVSNNVEAIDIIIVSDGLHNISGGPSAYVFAGPRNLLDPALTARLQERAMPMPKANIYFYLIPRLDHINRTGNQMFTRQREVIRWLEDYYEAAGATFILRTL